MVSKREPKFPAGWRDGRQLPGRPHLTWQYVGKQYRIVGWSQEEDDVIREQFVGAKRSEGILRRARRTADALNQLGSERSLIDRRDVVRRARELGLYPIPAQPTYPGFLTRAIVRLRDRHELRFKEIGIVFDMPAACAKRRYNQAKLRWASRG